MFSQSKAVSVLSIKISKQGVETGNEVWCREDFTGQCRWPFLPEDQTCSGLRTFADFLANANVVIEVGEDAMLFAVLGFPSHPIPAVSDFQTGDRRDTISATTFSLNVLYEVLRLVPEVMAVDANVGKDGEDA